MNPIDPRLQRLFRAAAAAQSGLPAEAPFWMERQVLAGLPADDSPDPAAQLIPLYKGALVCACAIILVSAALTLHSFNEAPPSEWVIVDSAIQSTLLQ
jgi:hypothetical protein